MPKKPKRPCSYPGCPKLTDGRFCEEHAKEEASRYEKYQRDPMARKRYGRAWTFIRKTYAAEHPFCEVRLSEGRYTPTEAVHHIKTALSGRNSRHKQPQGCSLSCPNSWRNRRQMEQKSKGLRFRQVMIIAL